jgi:ketosteroid isomerase-like protein
MSSTDERIASVRHAYATFNRREIDAALAVLDADVEWPNVAAGSVIQGHAAIRAYWQNQFRHSDPRVEPAGFAWDGERLAVTVHQVVRDLEGRQLHEGTVRHLYTFRGERVARMEVHAGPE